MAITANLVCKTVASGDAGTLIQQFADASWRQMPAYAEMAARQIGATSEYVAVYDGDVLVGLANIRLKKLPVLSGGIALLSHGPMTVLQGAEFDAEIYAKIVAALKDHIAGSRKYCLRLEPALSSADIAQEQARALSDAGFDDQDGRRYQTFVLDLTKGEEQLRADLNGKWRTDLRRGEKQELTITRSSDPAEFAEFAPLLADLSQTKGFAAPQDTAFFAEVAGRSEHPENISIHKAYADGELIAGHIGAFSGDTAVYLLGATNKEGRDLRASYRLQWAVIEHAIERGMARYDLGGADEADNPSVFRFKKRMGGDLMTNLPMVQAWPSPWSKMMISTAEKVYKAIARFR